MQHIALHLYGFQITHSEAMHNVSVHQLPQLLPTTVGTVHGLNCFSHVIYAPQINTYQNIVKHLTRSSK